MADPIGPETLQIIQNPCNSVSLYRVIKPWTYGISVCFSSFYKIDQAGILYLNLRFCSDVMSPHFVTYTYPILNCKKNIFLKIIHLKWPQFHKVQFKGVTSGIDTKLLIKQMNYPSLKFSFGTSGKS